MEIELENPLLVPLQLTRVQLLCEYEPQEEDFDDKKPLFNAVLLCMETGIFVPSPNPLA